MRVLMTGAAGMLGRKLTKRLVDVGTLRASPIERIDLVDIVEPPNGSAISAPRVADICQPTYSDRVPAPCCGAGQRTSGNTPEPHHAWGLGHRR